MLAKLLNDPINQTLIVSVSGCVIQAIAARIAKSGPPGERTETALHVAVVFLSFLLTFVQQYLAGTLNAFDPKPWTDFVSLVCSSW